MDIRKTGIEAIGDATWGTHFCQFYQTKQDLLDILVPYFKAGLEAGEFCMWITSEPLLVKDARAALRRAVKDFDARLKRGQIEILDYRDWYLLGGTFDADRVLAGWAQKEDAALAQGFEGLRLSGNTFWLEKDDWRAFTDYEEKVNSIIGKHRMLALCTYSLDRCNGAEVMDVVKNHQFALVRRGRAWEGVGSAEHTAMVDALKKSEARYHGLVEYAPVAIFINRRGRIDYANPAMLDLYGASAPEELLGKSPYDIFHPDNHAVIRERIARLMDGHAVGLIDERIFRLDGQVRNVEVVAFPFDDSGGRAINVILHDITDRKKADEALRESREDLNRAQAVAHTGSWRLDVRKNELVWSDEAYRIFGMPRGAYLNYEMFLASVHPEDRAHVDERWQAALRGEPYDIEHRIVVGGETKWVRERAELEFDQAGTLTGGFGTVQDMTELKRAMEHIEFLSQFPRQNPNPVLRLSRDGTITYANDASRPLLEDFGYQLGGAVDGVFLNTLHKSIDANRNLQLETESRGKTFSFLFHPSPDGAYANAYGMDITSRKKLIQSLSRSTRELHTRVKHLNCLYGVSDLIEKPDSTLDSIFQGVCELLPQAMQYPENACARIFYAGLKFESRNFRDTPLKLSRPLRRNEEEMGSLEICYFEDVTSGGENPFQDDEAALAADVAARLEWAIEKRHWTEELRRSKDMLENISQGISEGLFLLSKDYRVIWANRAAIERAHFKPEQVIGCHCYELLHGKNTPCHENGEPCPLVDMFAAGEPASVVHEHLDEHSVRHIIETTAYPLKDQNGEVQQIIHLSRDVTESKRAEESLKAAHEELIKLNQVRSEFTSMVSHELRTPLGSIKESIDIVLEGLDGPLTADQAETLGIAKRNVDRLARLINNILDLSRLESGRMEVRMETIDLNAMVADACELMRPAIDRHALAFSVEVPPEPLMAPCDADKMKQVLTNLLDNAVKFTQPGGRIAVRLSKEGESARIDVQDSGIGIGEKDLARIFETFTQAQHDGMRKAGGSGLGLTISRRIAELHGGTISVASQRGQGSTFSIILPARS